MNTHLLKPALFCALTLGLASLEARATDFFDSTLTIQGKTLDLGAVGRTADYTVFTTNGPLNMSDSSAIGSTALPGNIGVEGDINLSGTATVFGNATVTTTSHVNLSGSAHYTGSLIKNNTPLSQGVSAASTLSSTAGSLSATTNYTASSSIGSGNVSLSGSSLTITATNSSPVVLKLTNFTLSASTFTLVGTAMTQYIIDVSSGFNLSGSTIQLSGGLLAGNVIFDLTGSGGANLSASSLSGIVLAANGPANLSGGSSITGELIAKTVSLSGGSKVTKPKQPSP